MKKIIIIFLLSITFVYAQEENTITTESNNFDSAEAAVSGFEEPEDDSECISYAKINVVSRQKSTSKPLKKSGKTSKSSSQTIYDFQLIGKFAITNENPPRVGVKVFLYAINSEDFEPVDEDETNDWAYDEYDFSDSDTIYADPDIIPGSGGDAHIERFVSCEKYDFYDMLVENYVYDEARQQWKIYSKTSGKANTEAPYTGQGERTGEVLTDKAVLHTRLTKGAPGTNKRKRGAAGKAIFYVFDNENEAKKVAPNITLAIDNSSADFDSAPLIDTKVGSNKVKIKSNYRWTVKNLEPDTEYWYRVKTQASIKNEEGLLEDRWGYATTYFRTVPEKDYEDKIGFTVVTGFDQVKNKGSNFEVFNAMKNLSIVPYIPRFVVFTGDTVYYDPGGKRVGSWGLWHALYASDKARNFLDKVSGYWQVDDHDYWSNNINKRHPKGWHIFRTAHPTPGFYDGIHQIIKKGKAKNKVYEIQKDF